MESAKKASLADLREALATDNLPAAEALIEGLHPAEIALMLESLPVPERESVWQLVDEETGGDILVELNDEVRQGLLEEMETEQVVAAAEGMELDDLADVLADLPDEVSDTVLEALPEEDQEQLKSVLAYPEDSAGGIMDPDVVYLRAGITIDVAMRFLRRARELQDGTPSVFVTDRSRKFLGVLTLTRMVTSDPDVIIDDVMDTSVEPIPADRPASEVALAFQSLDLYSAPVVDEGGRLIGEITADDVMDVIQELAEHDILGMAGLDEEDDMFAPVVTSAQRRAIWLGVNLATAFLAAAVVALFKPALEKVVMLAVLMPVVASMGGIAGSQTLTLMIRGIALGRVQDSNARWLLFKEVSVGALNGVAWAIVVAIITVLFFAELDVGIVIAAALVISLMTAAFAGFAIPLILHKMKIDPALAGTVILTTVTDIVGFATFLGLGALFLI